MSFKFNPLPRPFDLSGGSYLPLSGGTITGDVTYPKTGMILTDANGLRWRLTVDTTGALTTTAIVEGTIGSPWLFLFGNI